MMICGKCGVRLRFSLTAKQRELRDFIAGFIEQNDGIAPTFDEMREALQMSSKGPVHRLIRELELRGWIERLPHRARAVRVIADDGRSIPK